MKSRFQLRFESQIDVISAGLMRLGARPDDGVAVRKNNRAFLWRKTEPWVAVRTASYGHYGGARKKAVAHCVAAVAAVTLGRRLASVTRDRRLMDLGADDLDAEEIVDACEGVLGLPQESVWRKVTARPSRLTIGQLSRLFVEGEQYG